MSKRTDLCVCEHPRGGHMSDDRSKTDDERMGRCENIGCPCRIFRYERKFTAA